MTMSQAHLFDARSIPVVVKEKEIFYWSEEDRAEKIFIRQFIFLTKQNSGERKVALMYYEGKLYFPFETKKITPGKSFWFSLEMVTKELEGMGEELRQLVGSRSLSTHNLLEALDVLLELKGQEVLGSSS